MKIAICDDNLAVTGEIDQMLQKIGKEEKINLHTEVFFDGDTLWEEIQKSGAYDLIYLDIEMERMDGITVAKKIREKDPYTILIFVSAYESYCRQLFEVEPFRFLDKPIDYDIFREYFLLAHKRLNDFNGRFVFQYEKRIYHIPLKEIRYFEKRLRQIYVHCQDTDYRFYGKMNEVQKRLEETTKYFIQVQKSYIVNFACIRYMNVTEVELLTGEKFMLSKEFKKSATEKYLRLIGESTGRG